jgi:hypothetical protein
MAACSSGRFLPGLRVIGVDVEEVRHADEAPGGALPGGGGAECAAEKQCDECESLHESGYLEPRHQALGVGVAWSGEMGEMGGVKVSFD